MVDFHGATLASANAALTAFCLASAIGILIGGIVADRTDRHDLAVFVGVVRRRTRARRFASVSG